MIRCLGSAPVFCLVVLGACASAAPDGSTVRPAASFSPLDLSPWQPPAGQECEVTRTDSLPSVGSVFDSAALVPSARSVRASGALLLSVGTDSLGIPSRFHQIDATLPPAEAEMLEDSLRVYFQGGAVFGARVRIDVAPGSEPRFRIGSRQQCAPALRNRREIQRYMEDANQRAVRAGRVVLWVFVKEDGSVANARVVDASGNAFLDAVSVGIATQMKFHPALMDRQPVPVSCRPGLAGFRRG
jgi:TonB family protein